MWLSSRQTRGGSVSRSKCRCFAERARRSVLVDVAGVVDDQAGIGFAVGSVAECRPSPAGRCRGTQHQDRLAVAVLVLHELERRGRRRRASRCASPSGRTTASNSTDGVASIGASTSIGSRAAVATAPSAARRSAAPHRPRPDGRRAPLRASPSTPSATRMRRAACGCCRRRGARTATAPATWSLPASRRVCSTFGIGAGISACRARRPPPRPAPARRSSGRTPSARGSPASAPSTARSGRR